MIVSKNSSTVCHCFHLPPVWSRCSWCLIASRSTFNWKACQYSGDVLLCEEKKKKDSIQWHSYWRSHRKRRLNISRYILNVQCNYSRIKINISMDCSYQDIRIEVFFGEISRYNDVLFEDLRETLLRCIRAWCGVISRRARLASQLQIILFEVESKLAKLSDSRR